MAIPRDGVQVEIFDQEYRVRGDLDPKYLETIAKYVDGKMRSIAERSHNADSLRVAVLAALNIADEYHQLKSRLENVTSDVGQRVDECSEALDRLLKRVG